MAGSHLETENDESESTESSSSLTESEDESEKSRDEEKVESAQALALPPTAPQETQASQHGKLKLCPPDHFHTLKTTKADEVICFGRFSI
ncbi:caspase-12 isoform X3 [Orcinus orca]|uniref:caspase-12 isoform X3 n=1 Tax=Orcinus orca TaxID=9733 RepID=UPI002110F31A|nr:caspase-12 isoform X3 [Orcinus orca]